MKRIVAALLLTLVASLAADTLARVVQSALYAEGVRGLGSGNTKATFTAQYSSYLQAAVFVAVYFVAGAVVGVALRNRTESLAAALAVGLASLSAKMAMKIQTTLNSGKRRFGRWLFYRLVRPSVG